MLTRYERQARIAAAIVLHGIGRQYFGYPPLEESWWHLPDVLRWDPWTPARPDLLASRRERKLVGSRVVPSLVWFINVSPSIYMTADKWTAFNLHMLQRTGSRWDISTDRLPEGIVVAERLSHELRWDTDDGTRHRQLLPTDPTPPRERLLATLTRGRLGGWAYDREADTLSAEGHSAVSGQAHGSDVRELRAPIHGRPGVRDSRRQLRAGRALEMAIKPDRCCTEGPRKNRITDDHCICPIDCDCDCAYCECGYPDESSAR